KGSLPIKRINAHGSKIYGIDWAHDRRNELVTCSLDKTIKVWDTATADLEPRTTIQTGYPVWRARALPFGHGVLSLPQRGATALEMYGQGRPEVPVQRFEGHTDVVKEFVWRKGGEGSFSRRFVSQFADLIVPQMSSSLSPGRRTELFVSGPSKPRTCRYVCLRFRVIRHSLLPTYRKSDTPRHL
ncbi:hypothetical protein DXG03_005938, partial [Asterophora parasitica]